MRVGPHTRKYGLPDSSWFWGVLASTGYWRVLASTAYWRVLARRGAACTQGINAVLGAHGLAKWEGAEMLKAFPEATDYIQEVRH